jgi:hypothetical protein
MFPCAIICIIVPADKSITSGRGRFRDGQAQAAY